MNFMGSRFVLIYALLITPPALADEIRTEDARESDLFAEPDDARESINEAALEGRLFGEQSREVMSSSVIEMDETFEDTLTLGGQFYITSQYALGDEESPLDANLSAPSFLYLYMDGRPSERVRFFARTRIDHQLMRSPQSTVSADSQFFGPGAEQTRVSLDQLWLKFDVNRKLFITAGRQRIKWGAARLWNPTDFINQEIRDPLAIFDARLGVPLLKVHLPFEGQGVNLYAIAMLAGANSPADMGMALRAEVVLGLSEISLSFANRKNRPTRLGADLSAGIGPVEFRVEGAARRGGSSRIWRGPLDVASLTFPEVSDQSDQWLFQGVSSIEWGIAYGDQESLFVTAEYFYNHQGYSDPGLYPWLFTQGDWLPLYVGQHYIGGNVALPRPGSWNDSTFVLSGLGNLSDRSYLLRFDYQVQILTQLNLVVFATHHFGDEGEFNYALELEPVPTINGLENGLSLPGPFVNVGVWLSTVF